jgi:hypothetical protein
LNERELPHELINLSDREPDSQIGTHLPASSLSGRLSCRGSCVKACGVGFRVSVQKPQCVDQLIDWRMKAI